MKEPLSVTLEVALSGLKCSTVRLNTLADLDGLAASHFDTDDRLVRELDWQVYCQPIHWLKQASPDLREAPQLAVLGYLLAEEARRTENTDDEALAAFQTHAALLKLRINAFSLANSWVLQPHVILGVSLGVLTANDNELLSWLRDLIKEGYAREDNPLFLQFVYFYLLTLVSGDIKPKAPLSSATRIVEYSLLELALAMWLVSHGILNPPHEERDSWLRMGYSTLVEKLLTVPAYENEDFKAALIWVVIAEYVSKWSRALVYLGEHLILNKETDALILRDNQADNAEREAADRTVRQVTREREFFMRASLWLASIILVVLVSIWVPNSLALWISCSVSVLGLGAVIFLPFFGTSWFANPLRQAALYLIGTPSVLSTSWAIVDASKWDTVIYSMFVGGLLTLVQVAADLRSPT